MKLGIHTMTAFGISLAGVLQATPEAGPSTTSPGATQLSSGDVVLDSALDPAGGTTASSTSYTLKPGFVGQLYDVVSLDISAQPGSVSENATAQLSASGTLDDDTTLAVDADIVSWSVVSGPLASISPAGIATAGSVFTDTLAMVGGSAFGIQGGGSLTVRDAERDNFGPVAGDGIEDAWQFLFFDTDRNNILDGSEAATAAPNANPDLDESNNFTEWAGGFDPLQASSDLRFRILSKTGALARFEISSTREGTSYSVFRSTTLEPGSFSFEVDGFTADADGTNVVTEDTDAPSSKAFYRVLLEREP